MIHSNKEWHHHSPSVISPQLRLIMASFSTPCSISSAWGGGWPPCTACTHASRARLGVCCCCSCCCCWEGAAKAPVATLLSLHPDRDIIASRVSAALLRAHTAAIGTAASAHRACCTTHPSTKSGIRSNSRVIASDAHFGIKPCFCSFSHPPTPPDTRLWPVSTASPLINCLDVYGRCSL